jgi:hypothetical protein
MQLHRTPILPIIILCLTACTPPIHTTDKSSTDVPFDLTQFNARYQTALYLFRYDMAAWVSTDSVMKEPESVKATLGQEWFCVEIQNEWHALYGRYDTTSHSYIQILHYIISKDGQAIKTSQILDSSISNTAARSLRTCLKESDSLFSYYHSFYVNLNTYYKQDSLGINHVWLLPGTGDEKAVYGMEYSFDVSSSGDSIIHKESIGQKLRYYIPDLKKEAILGNDYSDLPTLGNIFFVLHHYNDFRKVVIYNQKWSSYVITNPQTREISWIHIAK